MHQEKLVPVQYKYDEAIALFYAIMNEGFSFVFDGYTEPDEGYDMVVLVSGGKDKVQALLDTHNQSQTKKQSDEQAEARIESSKNNALRPAHYNQDNPYEVIKVIRAWGMNFELGNVLKYVARAGKKDPNKTIEDLEKAETYLRMHIDNLKAQKDAKE